MKRIASILLAFMFTAIAMPAQSRDLKSWDSGSLQWSDFRGTTVIPGSPSYIKATLNTTPLEETKNKKIQYRITATVELDRNESYADSASRTDQRLRYHQLQFDQLELFRRRLQNDLNTGMNGIEADNRLAHYRNLYKEQLEAIRTETENGTNEKKLQEWEYYTRKGLEEIGLPAAPEFVPSDWSYGIILGVGGVFTTSDIKKYFDNCFTFTAGLTGGYRRVKVKADISYGQPNFNTPNVFGVTTITPDGVVRPAQGPMNECPTYLSVGTTLGFSVVSNKRLAITPFVGAHWSGYSWNMANLSWNNDNDDNEYRSKVTSTQSAKVKDVSWIAGIDFDIKIHKYVTSTPFFLTGQREQYTSSIRITPYMAHTKFNDLGGAKGYHMGVTVSYAGIARALTMK